jgi:hypothetical protein
MGITAAETTGLWAKAVAWMAAHPLLAVAAAAAVAIGVGLMMAMTAAEE